MGRRRYRTREDGRSLRSRCDFPARIFTAAFSTPQGLVADAPRRRSVGKWAGADSNCGYGHPKAEGYQATPPART